jgi:hypothetical protein
MYKEEVFFRSRRVLFGPILFSVLFAVMQLSAFATGSVTLAWNPSTDPIVAGYNVYYGGASGTYTNEICAGNATNVTISGLIQGTTYYFAATTYASSGVESPFSSEVSYLVPTNVPIGNQPPTLNAPGNLSINENAGLQTVSLSGITSGATNEIQTLTVTAVSSNPGLIPNPTVNYTNASTTGTLTFTPTVNGNGTATITVTVNDGGASNNIISQTFTVTVNAVNNPPTLNAISNLSINENAGLQTVNLSGITSGATNEIQTLKVAATSSNGALISTPSVRYTSPSTTGKLTFTPVANATGTGTITVTVNDGGASNNIVTRTFTVTVVLKGTTKPSLLSPLTNKVVVIGKAATFSIAATGTAPLKYQWKFNGANLALATNAALTFGSVTTNQAGTYSVAVSNAAGSTNSTASLTVCATVAATLTSAAHASGQFALTVSGVSGYQYVVQASTNMVSWVPLQTNTAPFTFVDTNASQFGRRFYRSVCNNP